MARFTRWLRRLAVLAALALGLGVLALGILYWLIAPRLPDVQELRHVALQVPLSVYSSDGKLIAQFGETRRYPVKVDKIPAQVKNAFIAIEDARFYHHQGLDFRGITRAIWLLATTSNERVPGGSTITQQVAKNFYLSSEYSYSRKLMEMLLALKMERELSKDEILELYLNKIFFGNRAYGVAAAAEYYFGKPLDQLTLAEAAALAATPKFPSSANPIINPTRNIERRNYVLQRMRETGFISAAQEASARIEPSHASPHEPKIELEAPYVAEMVRKSMQDRYGAESETSGFRVYTTIRSSDQIAANVAVRKGLVEYDRRHGWRGAEAHIDDLPAVEPDATTRARLRRFQFISGMPAALVTQAGPGQATVQMFAGAPVVLGAESSKWTGRTPGALLKRGDVVRLQAGAAPGSFELTQIPKAEAALVSLHPEDGSLAALLGGLSFARNQFNRVTQAQRQPGSAFKPFLYSAAMERGYTPASIVLDAPVVFRDRVGHVWRPQNDNGKFSGPMRMREALVQSRNLVSVRLLDAIGIDFARKYITQFGFTLESLPPNLSMSLGTASLTPMSVARGYSVFANGGFLIEPYFIARILDRNGVAIATTHAPRACRGCAQRASTEQREAVVVDDFDFSANGPAAASTARKAEPAQVLAAQPEALAPRAIDERTAFLARSLMLDVVLRGTATAAKVIARADIGGKTGSTNNHRDAWFSGFGGNLVTTVWVGRDNFESLGYREYGGKAALPIWIGYMTVALKDVPLLDPTPPEGIVTVAVNRGNGNIVPDGTPGSLVDYMKSEDYDRIVSGGYNNSDIGDAEDTQSYDIF
ncbi:MAG: penicillin-binding protein 1A [Arenimonas sp.]